MLASPRFGPALTDRARSRQTVPQVSCGHFLLGTEPEDRRGLPASAYISIGRSPSRRATRNPAHYSRRAGFIEFTTRQSSGTLALT
jgi:hypothetical protein